MRDIPQIRAMTGEDLPMVLDWRNAPAIRHVMFNSAKIGLDEHRAWFDRASQDPTRRLLIVETNAGPLGFVQFGPVAPGGISDWGFYAGPEAPKGSGRILGLTALDHAFFDLKLHKVCGQALEFNAASIRLHERLGFCREGLLRQQHRTATGYCSVIHFGLLHAEWPEARAALWSPEAPREGERQT